jgi:hypothetical protein
MALQLRGAIDEQPGVVEQLSDLGAIGATLHAFPAAYAFMPGQHLAPFKTAGGGASPA